jgi:trimeric autotransporter adhesin
MDPRRILNRVVALPIAKWAYKDDAAHIQHIGPMAQDFYAAFDVGADDKHINPVDSDGVALAAIQGLYQVVQDKETQIAALQQQNADLSARVSKLERNSTTANPPAQAESFNLSTLLSVLALGAVGWLWLQQQRSKRGAA